METIFSVFPPSEASLLSLAVGCLASVGVLAVAEAAPPSVDQLFL